MSSSTVMYADSNQWAEAMFGGCELGDARRTRRAVDYAARQAAIPGGSTNEVCAGDDAATEAAYRFMRNDAIEPRALEEGPFQYNAAQCTGVGVVLAIQDTTTLTYPHAVSEQLGDLGGGRGFLVHSTLAVDGETRHVIGLLDQQRWSRPPEEPGQRRKNKKQRRPMKSERVTSGSAHRSDSSRASLATPISMAAPRDARRSSPARCASAW
jgi:hypothetical protein